MDTFTVRVVVGGLALLALVCVIAAAALAMMRITIPDFLISTASTCIGGLTALVLKQGRGNDRREQHPDE